MFKVSKLIVISFMLKTILKMISWPWPSEVRGENVTLLDKMAYWFVHQPISRFWNVLFAYWFLHKSTNRFWNALSAYWFHYYMYYIYLHLYKICMVWTETMVLTLKCINTIKDRIVLSIASVIVELITVPMLS